MLALLEVVIGTFMVILTTIVHALFMVSGTRFMEWRLTRHGESRGVFSKSVLLSGLTAWQFLAVVTESSIWALHYLLNPLIATISDLGTAVYFSMATFTTVGYGDVVLEGGRVLASFQAANGMIIFGWSTALIFYYIQRIHGKE